MPELPEVETVRRGLAPHLIGRTIVTAELRRADLRFPFTPGFAASLAGQRIETLTRRAKYLLLGLSNGATVVAHLGMTGRFSFVEGVETTTPGHYNYNTSTDPTHDHVILDFGDRRRLIYNDPRRFGYMLLISDGDLDDHKLFRGLGVEPLGNAFTAEYLAARAMGRSVHLKALLMDQRVIAGLGNIYVSEALHDAGLSPRRQAASLADRHGRPTARAMRLVPAIRRILDKAIAAGGSTLRDYRQADGSTGQFQDAFAVYDRAGAPCLRRGCTGTIKRIVQQGRATFFCGTCQS